MVTERQILQVDGMAANTIIELFNGLNKRLDELGAKVETPKRTVFLTRNEVGERLKISLPTVWAWSKQGILKPHRLGNKIRFIESEVIAAAKSTGRGALSDENK